MTDSMTTATQVPALDFQDLAQAVVRQPDLFASLAGVAEEQAIVRAAREHRYTGTRTPEARAAQIVALRKAGTSLREIQRQTGADKRTIHAVVELAEKQGLVTPLKEVLQRRLSTLAEQTADVIERELDSPDPDAQLIKAGWVGLGIAADKSAALANVGELHLHLHHGAVAAGPDPAAEYARMLRSGPTVDAESEVLPADVPEIGASVGADTDAAHAAAPAQPGRPPAARLADQAAAAGADLEVGSTGRGAGGVEIGGPLGGGDGKA